MNIKQKIPLFLAAVIVFLMALGNVPAARAATPVLSLALNSNGNTVQVTVNGDPNASVIFYYTKTNVGAQTAYLGLTNASGVFSTNIDTSSYVIVANSTAYVTVGGINGLKSNTVTWPNVSASGNFYVSPTSVALSSGQTSSITAYNLGSSSVYMSNNSNPPIANVNINGSQITVTALGYGSTVINLCIQGNTANCASVYVTVQNGNVQALTFSISNVTVSPGQSVPVTITGGTGVYSVQNNSNSSVIQASISGNIITLTTTATSGSGAITVCSSDMGSCGIINVTASSVSSTPLVFSPLNPVLSIGQVMTVALSNGSTGTYFVSANSNSTAVTASVSGSSLLLTGLANGSSNITVCSSAGSCGTLPVTVSYTSNGGVLQLSQSTVSLLVGQVLSITVSGGTTPYNLYPATQGSIFQASLSGNIVTLSGISAGSATVNVCTAGGACQLLSVIVNSSGAGTPVTFSQNNLSINVGAVTAVALSGGGGYYVSNSSNSNVASVQISGSVAAVTGLAAGSTNISVCQSGGQCAILFVTVTSGSTSALIPSFSAANPTIAVGQTSSVTVSGGAGSNYYISANSNPNVASLSVSGNALLITGLAQGSSSVAVCATANSCGVLTVTVSGTAPASTPISFASAALSAATTGQAYNYQLQASGGSGSLVYSVTSGNLPAGLVLSTSGLISGTTNATGISNFTVKVTDGSGQTASASFNITGALPSAPSGVVVPTSTPVSAGNFSSGELINEGGTIYIVYQNTKVGFANAPAFLGLGFSFDNVTNTDNSGLALSDKVVVTADGAHPRGTWVISGQTVYFLTPAGLIPVSDWNTFLGNGGQASYIVKANSYDMAFKQLPLMTANDSRVK
ncbi:MAG: Ig domain-containing protein [Candidatus Doudnabacteria bacterium]|nr:Ig domain-containing protein [Candidatus Doudnabacteria bacterium]